MIAQWSLRFAAVSVSPCMSSPSPESKTELTRIPAGKNLKTQVGKTAGGASATKHSERFARLLSVYSGNIQTCANFYKKDVGEQRASVGGYQGVSVRHSFPWSKIRDRE